MDFLCTDFSKALDRINHERWIQKLGKRVSEQKDLSVIIDRRLLFAEHSEAITSKATTALCFVKTFDITDDITDLQIVKTHLLLIGSVAS